jgi:predicted nuclease of predicted toxin-antitoxin system
VPAEAKLLLDQNVPYQVAARLRMSYPSWDIWHASDLGLGTSPDTEIVEWARQRGAVTVTFDEDLADQRLFPLGSHAGVVRLRVEPSTESETLAALDRLFSAFEFDGLRMALTIVDARRIRQIRP